jgi:hypothetical protein
MVVLIALGVFVLALSWNALAARAIRYVAEGDRWRAAGADLVLGASALAFTFFWIEVGWWTAGPELLGGFLGTALGTVRKAGP